MTHCGMVPNWVTKLIEFQLTSLDRTEVLALVLILTSTTVYFDNNLCTKGDGKCNDPSMILKFSKVLILLV